MRSSSWNRSSSGSTNRNCPGKPASRGVGPGRHREQVYSGWSGHCTDPGAMDLQRRGQRPQNEFLTQDLVAVQAKSNDGADFVLAAAYFPGNTLTAPPEAVGNLVDYCRRNTCPRHGM
nr:uncharacterized protein LOC118682570 [Bactrocera oleae]